MSDPKLVRFWARNGWHYGHVRKVTYEIVPCGKKNAVKVDGENVHTWGLNAVPDPEKAK